ncbi:MAG: RNB domain-containing ribonuclease [Deltaproteobacteria bacterium]|nr:RNB domain-containing ribonuclease [Deltaproteobacteria bacterium]
MIIEYLQDNAFTLAFAKVLEESVPGKTFYQVMTGDRPMRLHQGRVLSLCDHTEPVSELEKEKVLKDLNDKREALSKSIDLLTLWELLEGEGDSFDYSYLANLTLSEGSGMDQISAAMRAVYRDGLYFRFSPQAAKRNSKETVEEILNQRELERRGQRVFAEGKEWLDLKLKGQNPTEDPYGKEDFENNLVEVAISEIPVRNELKDYVGLLTEHGYLGDPQGAIKLLRDLGVFSPHENIPLRKLKIPLTFSQELLDIAHELSEDTSYLSERRLDLTGTHTITIDSPGAMEFDDALSLVPRSQGGFTLGVHIADPTAFILPGSPLDLAARVRASSIYLPENSYSMLPSALTDGLLSLRYGEKPRPAWSLLIDLGEDYRVHRFYFQRSLITVDQHLTFRDADWELESDGPLGKTLKELLAISQSFLKKRLGQGGFLFNLPQRHMRIGPDGEPTFSLNTLQSVSYSLLGELMILSNHLTAMSLKNAGLPCPYRYQLLMKGSKNLESPPEDPQERFTYNLMLRRRLGRSGISLEPSRHRGLGLSAYTYFTSPMRRYFDMLVHRQVGSMVNHKPPFYDAHTLEEEAINADRVQRSINRMQQFRERYWLIYILASKIGESFKGLVYDRKEERSIVCLPDYMLDIELYNLPLSVQPGVEISVKLAHADYEKNILVFTPE